MPDYPILFRLESIQAIMTCKRCGKLSTKAVCPQCGSTERLKSQTRRVITEKDCWRNGLNKKCQEVCLEKAYPVTTHEYIRVPYRHVDDSCFPWEDCGSWRVDPKYQPGDLLWIKEGWCIRNTYHDDIAVGYDDGALARIKNQPKYAEGPRLEKWRSPRFMPKSVARLWLRVTDSRAKRLQEISAEDAIAEGLREHVWDAEAAQIPHIAKAIAARQRWWHHVIMKRGRQSSVWNCPVKAYRELWDDINAKRGYPWDDNPWVWCYKFEVAEKGSA